MKGRGYKPSQGLYHHTAVELDGYRFDSRLEADRYLVLKDKIEEGEITDLEVHPKWELLPAVKEADTIGPRGGRRRGKVIQRVVEYEADFSYRDAKTGALVVEDVKGCTNPDFNPAYRLFDLKRKIMRVKYGIDVQVVGNVRRKKREKGEDI